MSNNDGIHPPHNCKDCGNTHTPYSELKKTDENKRTRNILILIAIISIAMIPGSITVFDLIKDPSMISNNIDSSLINSGYDLACVYNFGMQYCLISNDGTNYVAYNSEKLVLQSKDNPCLDMNLKTEEKVVNYYNVVNGTDCVTSLEFPVIDHWYWNPLESNNEDTELLYGAEKSKQWLDKSNCPETIAEDGSKKTDFCNWWLNI